MPKLPNAPISDSAIRAAFMMDAPKPRHDISGAIRRNERIAPRKPRQATLSAYKPSLGEKIQDGIASGLSGLGVSDRYANHFAGRAIAPLNDVTPVGTMTGAADAGTTFGQGVTQGDMAKMALGAGAFGLSVMPMPGQVRKAGKRGLANLLRDESGAIRAWHGSPHDFDKFSLSKIGTGEGNQAYGHGLYFAENPGVASSYVQPRGAEPNDVPPEIRNKLREQLRQHDYLGFDTFGQAISAVRSYPTDFHKRWEVPNPESIKAALDAYDAAKWPQGKRPRLYEVEIDADPGQFLDWDAPSWGQPSHVQDALRSHPKIANSGIRLEAPQFPISQTQSGKFSIRNIWGEHAGTFNTEEAAQAKAQEFVRAAGEQGGASAYRGVRSVSPQSSAGASEFLRDQGIPGIKYLDQGSRGTGNGTSNYVVFDDKLVSILGKH